MKQHYDSLSYRLSQSTTRHYSTSFTMGVTLLSKKVREAIYGIYGWVRLGDEIVDSFHDFDKQALLDQFKTQTDESVITGLSINPIIHAFQLVVNEYSIPEELYHTFLKSMEMDLHKDEYSPEEYEQYILGSAQVVGLMCLKVFVEGDQKIYDELKESAMYLGSAFQKVNFLRDLKADYEQLGRMYFPGVDFSTFNPEQKIEIEKDLQQEFDKALVGIKHLPKCSKLGVFAAYSYFYALYRKIKRRSLQNLKENRIRIPNWKKLVLTFRCYIKVSLGVF